MKWILHKSIACLTALMVLILGAGGAITALAMPAIQVLPGAGENLLINGDFENPAGTEWTLSETVAITADAKHTGSYGLRLNRSEIDAKATFLFTQVALAPNMTYAVTGDIRSSAGSDPEILFEVTQGSATTTKGSMGTKDGSWSHQTFLTIKTSTEYVYGKLTLSIYRGGTAYTDVDNVTMIATGEEWCPTPSGGMVRQTKVLYDDFNDTMLDPNKWLVSEKGWGGANGGLAAANLKLGMEDGRTCVIMESHGDRYEGNVQGVGGMTRRVGSGFATRDYFASGEYEVVCKIDDTLGVCTAFWSFSYIQYEEGDEHFNELVGNIRNTEIDWETPSPMDDGSADDHVSLNNLRTNCWGGKRPGEGGNYSGRGHNTDSKGNIISIADGKWHTLTYKWYSTAEPTTGKPAVVWYIDGKLVDSYDINNSHYNDGLTPEADPNNYDALKKYYDQGINVPYRGARFWLACWFPVKESKLYVVGNKSATTGWAGTPDFDVAHTYIDSVKITPYNDQANDEYGDRETVPNLAWALPNQYPGYAEAKGVMDAPTPETAINGQTVNVTWNTIPGATSYDIMMDGRTYNTATPAYTFSDLNVGNHTLQVRAKNGATTGIWSYVAMVSIGVPTVTAVANGSNIKVTWDPVPGATKYYMEIDNDPIVVEGAYIPFTSGESNKYLTGKEDGLHMIRVRSEGPKGMSNWSQQKYVLVGSGIALSTPTLTVTKDTSDDHKLNFKISSVSGATGYELLDVDTNETVSLTGTTYSKTVADGTYTYKVRAVNDIGPSEWSQPVTVRVGAAATLGTPVPTAAAAGDTEITVTWNAVSGATGYDVEADGVVVANATSPYAHTGLGKGTSHRYRVRAKIGTAAGEWSDYVYASTTGSSGGGGGSEPGGEPGLYTGLLQNGDFSQGLQYWDTDGTVELEDGHVKLTAGDITSIVLQTVSGLKPNTTYTFSADLQASDGLFAYLIVKNYDGEHGELSSLGEPITFTTGADTSGITFLAQVYKQQNGYATVDNFWVNEGSTVIPPEPSDDPSDDPSNDPIGDPSNDPIGDPSDDPIGDPSDDPIGDPSNDPGGDTSNDPGGDTSNDPGSDTSNDPGGDPVPVPHSSDISDGSGIKGDANGDGSVDMKDVLMIRKFIAGMTVTLHEELADVNDDYSIDMKDVLMIRKFIAGMIDSL